MNYQEAKNNLEHKRGDKTRHKLANNTYLVDRGEYVAVLLHQTEVVKFYPTHAELYSGGWHTMTTKARINRYGPVSIDQRQSIWYLPRGIVFTEGIKIGYDGTVLSTPVDATKIEYEFKQMKKTIKAYADGFVSEDIKAMRPSSGDCWLCLLRPIGNMTAHELSMNTNHLLSHIEEKYYVPSLLVNALLEAGYQDPSVIMWMDIKDTMKRSLVKYMQKRLLSYA